MNKINAESMQKAYDENYQTFLKKNTDYGSSFEESLNEFGEVAGIVRISDKYRRLVNLTITCEKPAPLGAGWIAQC